jgi:hypothetical protein
VIAGECYSKNSTYNLQSTLNASHLFRMPKSSMQELRRRTALCPFECTVFAWNKLTKLESKVWYKFPIPTSQRHHGGRESIRSAQAARGSGGGATATR